MSTMTRLQALPQAFCNEERTWYRGVTALDQNVIPVVNPEGFLTSEEIALLEQSQTPAASGVKTAESSKGSIHDHAE
jgi:hypothetical protein